ncbi:MAG: hypothetical protein QM831_44375 [Kofleriaceae bacterium]
MSSRVRSWVPFVLGIAVASVAFGLHTSSTQPAPPMKSDPREKPDPKPTPPKDRFTLGTSRAEVRRIMGAPSGIDSAFDRWDYGMSSVEFENDQVVGWHAMGRDRLKSTLEPTDPEVAAAAKAKGTFDEHASRDQVLGVEGPPDSITLDMEERWEWGFAHITFDRTGHIRDVWDPRGRLKLE